ncbi:GIN domain-containing protein [Polaribacter atrinae]|uniref:GIN domain-containing protein n=1 Tax=Polaribacter atrinae TaxID=1333662 RepID=UPI0030F8F9D6
MKQKTTLLFVLVLVIFNTTFSQEKIKGNKLISNVKTALPPFHTVVVNNNFKVELVVSNISSSIDIETDKNLHEYISFNVTDSILTIATDKKLKAKKLNIAVNYKNALKEIILNDDAEIESIGTIKTTSLLLKINDYGIADLAIKSDNFKLLNSNKSRIQLRSKSKLNIDSKDVDLDLSESCKVDMIIKTENLNTRMIGNSGLNIEGTANLFNAITLESSELKGAKLSVITCTSTIKDSAAIIVNASENITIEASDKSKTEVYGDAQIILSQFTGNSKLFKKEL